MQHSVTSIDVFSNQVVCITRGVSEIGRVVSVNNCDVTEHGEASSFVHLFQSEISNVELDQKLSLSEPLERSGSQIRLFDVPDGSLGIEVSAEIGNGSGIVGLRVLAVDKLEYFLPGDVITCVNGISLSKLDEKLALEILSTTKTRRISVIRKMECIKENKDSPQWIHESNAEGVNITETEETQEDELLMSKSFFFGRSKLLQDSPVSVYIDYFKKMQIKFSNPYSNY